MDERRRRNKVFRPPLTRPRMSLWKTDMFSSDVVPNDLHWAAEKGNINLLAHLLMQNHNVNATDSFGRTALHEASENNQLQAADWLVFDGADIHTKDFESSTPMSLCKSAKMAGILSQNATRNRPGIMILMEDTTYHVNDLDMRVITDSTFGPSPTYMICRRLSPSKSSFRSTLLQGERFWRDVIEYKVSNVTSWTEVTLGILVVDLPSTSHELVLKVEGGDGKLRDLKPKISKFKVKDNDCWLCTVKILLDVFGSFVLFSRPKSESLPLSRSGGRIISRNNSSVRLNVPPQAFKKDGNVLFTIEEIPEMEKEENILSMSHFFKLEHTTCSDSTQEFEMTLPIPDGYTGTGELVVLSRPGSSLTSEEEDVTDEEGKWEVREATVEADNRSVSFKTNRMGINSPIEVQRGTNREDLRRQSPRIYSKRKECHVKFLVVGKILGYNQFDLVVECVKSDQIYLRIQEWKDESYTKLRLSGDFLSKHNQKYRLELQGNVRCQYGLNDLHLEFLPGQTCHQSLLVKVLNTNDAPNGNVAVHALTDNGIKLVTQLPILLEEQLGKSSESKNKSEPKPSKNRGKQKSKIPRRVNSFPGYDPSQKEPPSFDNEDDEGYRLVVNDDEVSLPNDSVYPIFETVRDTPTSPETTAKFGHELFKDFESEIEACQAEQPTDRQAKSQSFRSARNVSAIRSRRASELSKDCLPAGVGESVTLGGAAASEDDFSKNARRLSNGIESVSLQTEPNRPGKSSMEEHTLNIAPASEDPDKPPAEEGLTAPVSDNFLVHLVQRMHPNFLMFIKLGLTNAEIKKIQRNTTSMDTEYTMFEMLVQCRKKRGDNVAFLHMLLLSFEEFSENDTKQWIVEWIKQWLQSPSKEKQDFARKIRPMVKRFDENG